MPSLTFTSPQSASNAPLPTEPPTPRKIPSWVKLAAGLVLGGQLLVLLLWVSGRLHGLDRNLAPQALLGGAVLLLALAAYVLYEHSDRLPFAPNAAGLAVLIVMSTALVGVYAINALPELRMRYDLASWSESYFLTPIIKWRAGVPLYTDPRDSNSSVYTFGAPLLTYLIASVLRHPTSIIMYRFIEQGYVVLCALFSAAAAWNLVRLSLPDRWQSLSRAWLVFFALASVLIATNHTTNAFNIYLHADSLGVLAAALGFWLMTKHAVTNNSRWLLLMAVMPSLAFLVKQYLGILALVYVIYIWIVDRGDVRRALVLALGSFGLLGLATAACVVHWGQPFRYWVLHVMAEQVVSFSQMFDRLSDAASFILLGLIGGAVLLRGRPTRSLLGLWVGWCVMVIAATYTGGITYVPTHLGPATVVGGCFFLAAVIRVWPDERDSHADAAESWFLMAICITVVFVLFSGGGYRVKTRPTMSTDLKRYTDAIEAEFAGLPPARVLTDFGDWVYLRDNVVIKDRAAILPVHMNPQNIGMVDRLRRKEYARILVRDKQSFMAWDRTGRTGVQRALLANYREVRQIPGVVGMDDWLYRDMLLSDVSVLEPIPASASSLEQGPTR
jgi:hypothetical protein